MRTYIVSHFHLNPKHNRELRFSNYRDAQAEFMLMSSDMEISGITYLTLEGDLTSWKRRSWNRKRADFTSGLFKKGK